jgi:RecA-family ATPase
MPAEQQDKPPQLWNQVLSAVTETLSPHAYDTWFRPIACVRCDADVCELIVPTESFRKGLLDNYSQVLVQAIARLTGSDVRLEISVQSPEALADSPASFPVVQACRLESAANTTPWLIERLWSAGAVGFVSGPPKSLKTWTALKMAVSVASGTPCFGSFAVHHSGPVLLYAAEDPMPALRLRIESLARNHGLVIDEVDIRVIAADSLRLDCPGDREKLLATVDLHRPVLVILDPLVRLHGVDENQVGPMAELLGHVRSLQRMTGAAVAIVHHARKNAAHTRCPRKLPPN